jgi:hypothetical protein
MLETRVSFFMNKLAPVKIPLIRRKKDIIKRMWEKKIDVYQRKGRVIWNLIRSKSTFT